MKKYFAQKTKCLLAIVIALITNISYSQNITPKYGITLCGAEFGEDFLPGILNLHYTYPTETDIDYFVSKGIDLIQLPIKWERVQRNLGGSLDKNELNSIINFIDKCAIRNINVTLVLQNFGDYTKNCIPYKVGESQVTALHLRDFWMKLSSALINKSNIYSYSIMAEPANMNNKIWFNTLQTVIDGIRLVDDKTILFIEGNNYSNAATWLAFNDNLKCLSDPSNNLVFNAHCYFDKDYSGRYKADYIADGANEYIGVERTESFVKWINENKLKGFIGEFGVPKNDSRWLTTMSNFLDYLKTNKIGRAHV